MNQYLKVLTMSDPATKLAEVPVKWLGDSGKFDTQIKRCNAVRQLFDRQLRSASNALSALEANPCEALTDVAETKFSELEATYETLSDGLLCARYIANEEATACAQVDALAKAVTADYEPVEDRFLKAPITRPKELKDQGASPAAKTIDSTLKPDVLSLEFKPCEFRKWKDSLEEFFVANGIQKRDPRVQNGFVKVCIDAELLELVSASIAEKDAFGPGGIVQLVTAAYNQKYTDTSKKLALFLCKPKEGEKAISFVARLKQHFQEADLNNMSIDEFQRFFLIAGISNSSLRNKLLEVQDPTFDKLVEKINTWTATQETSKAIAAAQQQDAKVKGVSSGRGRGQGRGRGGRGGSRPGRGGRSGSTNLKPPANIKITPETLSGRCSACGNTGHQKAKCPKADKATCTNCKKKGHFSNVCLFEFNAWRDAAETAAEAKKVSQEDEEHYESSASEEQ